MEAWKRGALKTLLFRVHTVCSNKELLEKDVKHLKHIFITVNGFPPWFVSQTINHVENEISTTQINQSIVNTETLNAKQRKLIFPHKGKKGEHTFKKNVKRRITKLLTEQGVALVSTVVCSDANCNEKYNGERGRRLIERVY